MEARPMDEEGYNYLVSTYPCVIMLPGHQVWYGLDDVNDAIALCLTERMWQMPEAPHGR